MKYLFKVIMFMLILNNQLFALSECNLNTSGSCSINGANDTIHDIEKTNIWISDGELTISIQDRNDSSGHNSGAISLKNIENGAVFTITPTASSYNIDNYPIYAYKVEDDNTANKIVDFNGVTFEITLGGLGSGTYEIQNDSNSTYEYTLDFASAEDDFPANSIIEATDNDTQDDAILIEESVWEYGKIGFSDGSTKDTVDYYSVLIDTSGEMNLTTQSIGARNVGSYNQDVFAKVEVLDANGNVIITSDIENNINKSQTKSGVGKGIYYIKITTKPDNNSYGSYGIKVDMNSIVLPIGGNDNDEDHDIDKANLSVVGEWNYSNIGYAGTSVDSIDYYKVVVEDAGRLIINTGSAGSANTGDTNFNVFAKIEVLDGINQTTLFSTSIRNDSNQTAYKDGMQAGTYYVKVTQDPLGSGYGSYGFSLDMNATVLPEPKESENNDNQVDANIIDINSSISGMIGYSDGISTDLSDFYKLVIDQEGFFCINVSAVIVAGTQNYGVENNSTFATVSIADASANVIHSSEIGNEQNLSGCINHMPIGTYYVNVINNSVEKSYGAYTITQNLNTTALLGDGVDVLEVESNDDVSRADTIEFSKWIGGGIGFNNDTVDYFHISLPSDGSITIEASDINSSVNGSLLDFATIVLFADGYEQNVGNAFGENNVIKNFRYDGLRAGNYYIKVTNPTTYGDYRFKVEFKEVVLSNSQEREPNNSNDEANVIYPNEINSGTIGYGKPFIGTRVDADQSDYFAMELPQSYSGDINCSGNIVKLTDINNSKTSGILAIMEIYDSRALVLLGTVPLYSDLTQRSLVIYNYQEKYIYIKIIGKNNTASNYGAYQFKLTPSSPFDPNFEPDFDQDGIPDSVEVSWGLNPENALDAHEDLDGDGVDNLTEYNDGTDATDYTDVKQHVPNTAILYLLSS